MKVIKERFHQMSIVGLDLENEGKALAHGQKSLMGKSKNGATLINSLYQILSTKSISSAKKLEVKIIIKRREILVTIKSIE